MIKRMLTALLSIALAIGIASAQVTTNPTVTGVGIATGSSISGGTAGSILYVGAGPVLAQSAGLLFDGAGKLTLGTTTGSIVFGTDTQPTLNRFTGDTYLDAYGASSNLFLRAGGMPATKVTIYPTAGQGALITAGTAASAVSALSITQTWNYNTAAITAILHTFTDTSSHANTLAEGIYGGAAGTTLLRTLSKAGDLVLGGSITAPLASDAASNDSTVCITTTTNVFTKGSGVAGICLGTSSERYKTHIVSLDVGLNEIMGLRPVSYYTDAEHGNPNKLLYGFTAEQGGTVLPKLMGVDREGRPNTFDYVGVVPVLVRATQELEARVRKLESLN